MTKQYDVLIRVSKVGARKGTEGYGSPEDQLAACETAVKDAGGKVAHVLKAEDQSGFTAVKQAWQTAIERVKAGQSVGVAFAWDDRFARNWWQAGVFFGDMEAAGGEMLFADAPGMDYRTPQGRAMMGYKAVANEQAYWTSKSKSDLAIKRMLGQKVPNRVPYGYTRNADGNGVKTDPELAAKALVPDPQTADVVRTIFAMKVNGSKWSHIADHLEAEGIPSPSGDVRWTPSGLRGIVANAVYTGAVVFGDETVEKAHKALVDPKVFKAAQTTRGVSRTGLNKVGLAGGLLVCSGCHRPLSVVRSGSTGVTSYACRGSSSTGKCPKPVSVNKARADAYLDGLLNDAATGKRPLDAVETSRQLADAKAALDAAGIEVEEFVVKTPATSLGYSAGLKAREDAHAAAQEAYDALLGRADAARAFPTSGAAWDALPLDEQRLAARTVIDHIVVLPFTGKSRKTSDVESRLDDIVWV
jgi:DNA invertase Pin-like site-specific DNA recombinase